MDLIAVGLNHRQAPVEVRERLAIPADRLGTAIERLRSSCPVSETVVLSTCNRVEIYAVSNGRPLTSGDLRDFLARESGMAPEALGDLLYTHDGADAVRHLFRVAASLDSMVLGETQILGQVRDAYLAAKAANATGRLCNTLFQRALAVAKSVHSSTSLGRQSVSVSSVAVEFILKVYRDLSQRMLLLLGAGETARDTAARLRDLGVGRVVVVNRTQEAAAPLAAELGGQALPLDVLDDYLKLADIVIACASSPRPLVSRSAVEEAMALRGNRPMFLMDIAVPRNIDPETNSIENVYLYNIDDLQEVVLRNLDARRREIPQCEKIIEKEVGEYMQAARLLDLSPALQSIQNRLYSLGRAELERTLGSLPAIGEKDRAELERMVERLVDRILNQPISALKEEMREDSGFAVLEAFKRLFRVS